MYEDKSKNKFNIKPVKEKRKVTINWRSLILKMLLLLICLFLVLWIVSLVSKNKTVKESNFSTNLQTMKTAALEYFNGSKLPTSVNGKSKITLQEMFNQKLVTEFKDQNNKSCDTTNSYAEATKINNTDYSVKVKLVCGGESDYVINTIQDSALKVEEPIKEEEIKVEETTNNTTTNTTKTNTNITKTATSSTKTPTKSTTSTTKTTTSSNIKEVTTNSSTIAQTCTYGKNEYSSTYPLAYIIPGTCAVSKDSYYNSTYSNAVSTMSATEYAKLVNEIDALKAKTGADLTVEAPAFNGVYNADGGLVGYQIRFKVTEKQTYTTRTIYEYYIDTNSNRTTVIDNRASLTKTTATTTTNNSVSKNVMVTGFSISASSISLKVNDTYTVKTTINPSNATNQTIYWYSSDWNVATVNSKGVITALRAGSATIYAEVDGIRGTIEVTVTDHTYTERIYSTGYIDVNTIKDKTTYSSTYQVGLPVRSNRGKIVDVKYGNITENNEYLNAYHYASNPNKELRMVGATSKSSTSIPNYGTLKDHALKNYNFTPKVTYYGQTVDYYYFTIELSYFDLQNIRYATPYKVSDNWSVYFLPLYFDIVYEY